ncbi:thioredoxin family protein [Desulfosediminicola flagellatus]|uniref:thioredoxin family protein n=1 Tax=Desulfosediminicola flagellatus TaxID=2569541 RepID=UPI0010AD7453|nr:thioredoxin family protein [Desulfosediminicola flagellatus]
MLNRSLKNYYIKFWVILSSILLLTTFASAGTVKHEKQIPVPGMVTMVDLGAGTCIPCKMMAPILDELEKEYKDRAAIVFIDVWENPDAGKNYGVKMIPTQIFYDTHGKEVSRHVGFLDKASIVDELEKNGVE